LEHARGKEATLQEEKLTRVSLSDGLGGEQEAERTRTQRKAKEKRVSKSEKVERLVKEASADLKQGED
jgi:hypothetical protein